MKDEKKRIGRPPLNEEISKGTKIKISASLHARIQKRGKESFRSVTGETNFLLEWALRNIGKEGITHE